MKQNFKIGWWRQVGFFVYDENNDKIHKYQMSREFLTLVIGDYPEPGWEYYNNLNNKCGRWLFLQDEEICTFN